MIPDPLSPPMPLEEEIQTLKVKSPATNSRFEGGITSRVFFLSGPGHRRDPFGEECITERCSCEIGRPSGPRYATRANGELNKAGFDGHGLLPKNCESLSQMSSFRAGMAAAWPNFNHCDTWYDAMAHVGNPTGNV